MMNTIKIYTLKDPITNEIRYIGKTIKTLEWRLYQHLHNTITYKSKNASWIKSLIKKGLKPIIELLDETTDSNWKYIEIYWISQFKTWGFNLTNMTDGGDGNNNQIITKESNIKRRNKLIGKKRDPKIGEKISKKLSGRELSNKRKKQISEYVIKNQGRVVLQYDMNWNFIKEWRCLKEAAKSCIKSGNASRIIKVCKNKANSAGGYKWKYK